MYHIQAQAQWKCFISKDGNLPKTGERKLLYKITTSHLYEVYRFQGFALSSNLGYFQTCAIDPSESKDAKET